MEEEESEAGKLAKYSTNMNLTDHVKMCFLLMGRALGVRPIKSSKPNNITGDNFANIAMRLKYICINSL